MLMTLGTNGGSHFCNSASAKREGLEDRLSNGQLERTTFREGDEVMPTVIRLAYLTQRDDGERLGRTSGTECELTAIVHLAQVGTVWSVSRWILPTDLSSVLWRE